MEGPPTNARYRLGALRARLGESLFADTPAHNFGFGRPRAASLIVAFLVLGTVLALLRLGLSTSLNTVWAEDGPVFLQAALTQNFIDAVSAPYAGYLLVVPRLIGEAGAAVPLRYAPAAVSIVSAACAALCGLVVWFAAAGHVRNLYLRGGLVLLTVLAPAAGQETLVSAAYVPWYMLFASFWLLIWRPATMGSAVLGAGFLLLTGLSTPGVWFFLPVVALRALAVRDRRDLMILAGYAVGAATQVPVVLGQEQGEPIWTSDILAAFVQRVVDGGLLGQRLGGHAWAYLGWPFLILLCACLGIALVIAWRRSDNSARWLTAVALPTGLVMFVVTAYQRAVGADLILPAGVSGGSASRYVLVPSLLLASVAIVLVDSLLRNMSRRDKRLSWAVAATIAVLALGLVTSFDMSSPEFRGPPHWDEALEAAAARCQSEPPDPAGFDLAGIVTSPPPFGVQIPCAKVASFAPEPQR